jgi:hypothetical protein
LRSHEYRFPTNATPAISALSEEAMINSNISELLGFSCHHLDDAGTLAVIDSPFVFEDEDSIPIYVQEVDQKVRFFDDGEVISHFMGLGIRLDAWDDSQFIEDLARPHGVTLNDRGDLEIWADSQAVPHAFARYLAALLEMVRWEREYNAARRERRRLAIAADAVTARVA